MKNGAKIAIVALLVVAVTAAFALRGRKRAEYVAVSEPSATVATAPSAPVAPVASAARAVATVARPRLLEIGSNRCMACLEMAKVLEALRASQGARLQVDFADIYEQPAVADTHKVSMIPTQILFNAEGKEIFRHQGYFSHGDILAKYRELGVQL